MKAYKGFNRDMTCRNFQYEEGKEYETDKAKLCESGFHACENPLDCLNYYSPNDGCIYHEVEVSGDIEKANDDSKVAATKIKIGARLTIAGIVKGAIDFVFSKAKPTSGNCAHAATSGNCANAATSGYRAHAATSGDYAHAATSGRCANAATSGYCAHAATSGYCANAATSGNCAHAATSGRCAHAATSGDYANAATSGDYAHAATSGDYAHAATSGDYAHAATSGDCANAATSGDYAHAEVHGYESIAAVLGRNCKARGALGCWLVLTERDDCGHILGVQAVKVDGKSIKADTWYELRGGKVAEAEEGGDK